MSESLPACCTPSEGASLAEQLYCVYNGTGENPGLNYRGEPCPIWNDLPTEIKNKWMAASTHKRVYDDFRSHDLSFGVALNIMKSGKLTVRPKGATTYFTLKNGNFFVNGRGVKCIVNIPTRYIIGRWEIVSPEEKAIMDSPAD